MNNQSSYEEILIRGHNRMTIPDLKLLEKTVREIQAKTIVEIGSMDGCSSLLLGSIAKQFEAKLYCIEPRPTKCWWSNIYDYKLEKTVTMIPSKSPWVEINLIPKPIDYLLIDGNHRTRWVLVDYHFFFPFIRQGGMIAFHDYNARKGVQRWVRRAIDIILEDDIDKLEEVEHNETKDRGMIVFRKIGQ